MVSSFLSSEKKTYEICGGLSRNSPRAHLGIWNEITSDPARVRELNRRRTMSIWDDLGNVAEGAVGGFIAGGIVGGVVGGLTGVASGGAAGAAASGGAGGIAGGAAGAAAGGAAGAAAGSTAGTGLGTIVGVIIGGLLGDPLFKLQWRHLSTTEADVIPKVFGSKYMPAPTDIVITNFSGFQGRPFTVPGSMIPALGLVVPSFAGLLFAAPILLGKYLINMGSDGFQDGWNKWLDRKCKPGQVLVHELTHVWQGYNQSFAWDYVFNSVINQIRYGISAYDYTPGAQWDTYQTEQQAHIVEDWFANGQIEVPSDDYFPFGRRSDLSFVEEFRYIEYNIRKGDPHAISPVPSTAPTFWDRSRWGLPIAPGLNPRDLKAARQAGLWGW
jgi:hypothetical protein